MDKFKIQFRKSVGKELKGFPAEDQIQVLKGITRLSSDPRIPLSKRLSGQERYRVCHGGYGILYEIGDDEQLVTIVQIGTHRKALE